MRRTSSPRPGSGSTTSTAGSSAGASARISPWGPATKLDPQKRIPSVRPEGSGSWPVRLATRTQRPLAIAGARRVGRHAPRGGGGGGVVGAPGRGALEAGGGEARGGRGGGGRERLGRRPGHGLGEIEER